MIFIALVSSLLCNYSAANTVVVSGSNHRITTDYSRPTKKQFYLTGDVKERWFNIEFFHLENDAEIIDSVGTVLVAASCEDGKLGDVKSMMRRANGATDTNNEKLYGPSLRTPFPGSDAELILDAICVPKKLKKKK